MLPLLPALEEIADAEIELGHIVHVVGAEKLLGWKIGQKLRVAEQDRIRS